MCIYIYIYTYIYMWADDAYRRPPLTPGGIMVCTAATWFFFTSRCARCACRSGILNQWCWLCGAGLQIIYICFYVLLIFLWVSAQP